MGRETNKSRRQAQAQTAREKAAAARGATRQAEQRRRAIVILSTVVAIAIVGGIIAVIAINHGGKNKAVVGDKTTIANVMKKVETVPVSTLDSVGAGSAVAGPQQVSGVAGASTPLTGSDGKPQLLFIGAEFCPYCAAERWAMAVALSRFGKLSGTSFTASSGSDVYPNTSTLDFKDASYTSKYLDFAPIEAEDRNHAKLQTVPKADDTLWGVLSAKYVNGGSKSFPFLDYGNKWVMTGPTFVPDKLSGLTQTQIANQLADPNSDVAKGIDGGANIVTATICNITNNQPASVCSSTAIKTIQSEINKGAEGSSQPGSSS